jgi:PAS domain S-box-containing protein
MAFIGRMDSMSIIHILLVEDETITAREIGLQLKKLGYRVSSLARSGEEAVKTAVKHRPDLIFMDIDHEVGMNGIETASCIRRKLNIPCIYVTSRSDAKTLKDAIKTEPSGFLFKPVRLTELQAVIKTALRKIELEKRLRESQEIQRALIESPNDALVLLDKKGVILDLNAKTVRWLSKSKKNLLGACFWDVFSKKKTDPAKKIIAGVMRAGKPERFEWARNGLWFDVTVFPVRDSAGKTSKTALLIHDVTDRKRDEEALVDERNLMRTLIDYAPDTIYVKDVEGRFMIANSAMVRLAGASSPDELIGKTNFDIYPKDIAELYTEDERAIIRSGEPLINREESSIDAEGTPKYHLTTKVSLRDSRGGVIGMLGMSRDITSIKLTEKTLERRAVQLQTASEVAHAASSILSLDELLPKIVELIRGRFDLYYVGLFLTDEKGRQAVLKAGSGEAGQKMLIEGFKLNMDKPSMVGWCIAHHKPRIALDVGKDAVRFDHPLLPFTRSEVAIPLTTRGRIIGAMSLQSARVAAFNKEDMAVFQIMADQVANAVENARLFDALTREQYLTDAMMDTIPDAIYFKDTKSRFIHISKAHAKIFNLADPKEAIGKTDFDFFTEEHARQAYEDEQRIIRTGESILNLEERETWPDKPDTWVSTSKMPLRDASGNIVGTFGISRDITDRKRMEEALDKERNLLRLLLDNIPDRIYVKDLESRFLVVNTAVLRKLGVEKAEDVFGKTDLDFYPPEFAVRYRNDDEAIMLSGQPLFNHEESTMDAAGNQKLTLTTKVPMRDSQGKIIGLVGIGRDITERKLAEEALRKSEESQRHFSERLAKILEAVNELSKIESFDDLCRRSVELGIERLGFDRIGLWFMSEDQKTMTGSFGTDETGRIHDERHIQAPTNYPVWQKIIQSPEPVVFFENHPLTDGKGKVISHGDHLIAKLWNGERVTGLLGADNLIRHKPITEQDRNILNLYSLALANLFVLKRTDEELRKSEEAQRRFSERLAQLLICINDLSKAESFDALCRSAVEIILEKIGVDRVGIWFFSPDKKTMHGSFGTDSDGRVKDERGSTLPVNFEFFKSIIQDKKPTLIFEREKLRDGAGKEVGLGEHAIASLWNGEEAIGFLGADNLIHRRPITEQDEKLLILFAVSLGHLCTLKRVEESLRESEKTQRLFSDRLARVLDAINELSRFGSFDDLCRHAVELGIERLGFDRIGLLFLSEDQKTMRGSYGTDETGRLRDERHLQLSVSDYSVNKALKSDKPVVFFEDEALIGEDAKAVGRGNHVIAKLWNGTEVIGILGSDNLISKKPITDQDQEILGLYATALANLCTLKRTEDALRQSEETQRVFSDRLTKLSAALNELSKVGSFDDLCRKAVEIALENIGLDRVGFWFFTGDGETMQGSFGTDENGNIQDERSTRLSVFDPHVRQVLQDNKPVTLFNNEPLRNQKGEIVGQGSHLLATLWNGSEAIGFVGADNLIHQRPITEPDEKLLSLLAVSLGHLCTLKRAEESLRESENRFRTLFEQAAVGVAQIDAGTKKCLRVNRRLCGIVGYTPDEMQNLACSDITHPKDLQADLDNMKKLAEGSIREYSTDKRLVRKDGSLVWVSQTVSAMQSAGEKRECDIVVIQDITDRKGMEEHIRADIKEKEVLLKEIHHRVKNNMQVIVSLLNLQSAQIQDPEVLEKFKSSQNRIYSMALVHEMLYGSQDLSKIDFNLYVENLVGNLFQSFGVDREKIKLELDLEPIQMGIDVAVPCGLILQELVSNALKHAFPRDWDKESKIRIGLRRVDDKVELSVADTGKGMPEITDVDELKSLGFKLVHVLGGEQLDGDVQVNRENGTRITLRFKEGRK